MSPGDRDTPHLLRDLAPQVLGALVRRFRDFSACEDAVQEALVAAAQQWPRAGLPDNPRGWLFRVASRRLTDQVRADAARRHREELAVSLVPPEEQLALAADAAAVERDDTLDLLFMCCHPALTDASAIALTLRAVGGLTTAEIARAFLVPEATMAQRISRAKATIQAAGARFEEPSTEGRARRLGAVLHVLYLVFNEGYTATAGPALHRVDLTDEALRLTRMLHRLLPEEAEVAGLLALMLLTDARRAARTGPGGELVPLDRQDRRLWDAGLIAEGVGLLSRTLPRGRLGPYQVQAAIAAVHDEAPAWEQTDWPQVLQLYGILRQLEDSPMVALSEAIALAMVHGPSAGLARLDALAKDARLAGHYRLDATRAHLLERAGDRAGALAHYLRAAERTASLPERDYLLSQAARLGGQGA
jgi:RNA polymerase sigma factor (sigma-70 family)